MDAGTQEGVSGLPAADLPLAAPPEGPQVFTLSLDTLAIGWAWGEGRGGSESLGWGTGS